MKILFKDKLLAAKKTLSLMVGLILVLFGQAAINTLPNPVMSAAGKGRFDSRMIEEFGPNTLGKAIIKKILEREKPTLLARDTGRATSIFRHIHQQPVVVSITSADLETFSRRGLLSAFENPLLKPKLNLSDYNAQITSASGVRFPSILDIRGEENREMKLWNSLRPKQAYILPNVLLGKSIHNGKSYQPPEKGLEIWSPMENEGNLILLLKEHVKEYSTFTFGNFFRDIPAHEVSSRVFTFFDKPAGDPKKKEVPWEARYIHVQIWGEVALSDVREVWVAASTEASVIEKIKKMGLPVYRFKRKSVDSEDRRGVAYETLGRLDI